MSTRWYPIYKRGNPQLRVFLTDFWMKMVRNDIKPTPPSNVVTFHCSLQMTKNDIKNYLEKIYKIPVVDVKTEVRMGEFFRDPVKKYVKKKDDYRVAIVTMVKSKCLKCFFFFLQFNIDVILFLQPRDTTFEFPNVCDNSKLKEEEEKAKEHFENQKDGFKKFMDRSKDSRGSPPWFSI